MPYLSELIKTLRIYAPLLVVPAALAHGASIDITVPWQCDQTYETEVPITTDIKITIDSESGEIISSDLDRLLSQAKKESKWDFFQCMQSFVEKVSNSLVSSAYDRTSEYENSAEQKAVLKLEQTIADYGAKAFQGAAIIPFEPGEASRVALTDDERQWLKHEITFLCGKSIPGVKRRAPKIKYLDKAFLSIELPKIIEEVQRGKSIQSDASKNCLKSIASSYLGTLLDASLAPNQCETHPKECEERNRSVQKVIGILSSIDGLKPFFSKTSELVASCQLNSEQTNEELNALLSALEALNSCISLKADESAIVRGDQGSGVDSRYVLSMLPAVKGKAAFRVTINPEFAREDAEFDVGINKYYSDKARKCLANVQDKLIGPNGERLEIKLYDDVKNETSIKNAPPPKVRVEIAKSEIRDHSKKWSPNSDCSTIIHELFHLIGLADEYEEVSSGVRVEKDGLVKWVEKDATIADYNCRAIGPKDSVMNSPQAAIKSVSPGKAIMTCQCTNVMMGMVGGAGGFGGVGIGGMPGGAIPALTEDYKKEFEKQMAETAKRMEEEKIKCLKILESISVNSDRCPVGTIKNVEDITYSEWESNQFYRDRIEKAEKREIDPMMMARTVRVAPKEEKESLLYPGQFRAITEPGCFSSNRTYYLCSREAYRTSRGAYGKDRCGKGLPKECSQGGAAWLE